MGRLLKAICGVITLLHAGQFHGFLLLLELEVDPIAL